MYRLFGISLSLVLKFIVVATCSIVVSRVGGELLVLFELASPLDQIVIAPLVIVINPR